MPVTAATSTSLGSALRSSSATYSAVGMKRQKTIGLIAIDQQLAHERRWPWPAWRPARVRAARRRARAKRSRRSRCGLRRCSDRRRLSVVFLGARRRRPASRRRPRHRGPAPSCSPISSASSAVSVPDRAGAGAQRRGRGGRAAGQAAQQRQGRPPAHALALWPARRYRPRARGRSPARCRRAACTPASGL